MTEPQARPAVSVVIAAYNERHTIERCLASLENQATSYPFEVILIDSSTDGTAELARKFRFVQTRHFAKRKYCGDARNEGLALARGAIVAFLDADCFVEPHWIEAMVHAHASPYLAVGGVVENGTPERLVAWAYYFCEFSLWLPRQSCGEIAQMAGCGLSIKRRAFEQYGPFLTGTYCSDTAFHWRLQRDGHCVLCVPAIRVFHTLRYTLREFLQHVVEHRRCFAAVTAQQKHFSRTRRLLAVLAAPVLPFLLLAVIGFRVTRSRVHVGRFLRASPLVFLGLVARACGEMRGYAWGPAEPS